MNAPKEEYLYIEFIWNDDHRPKDNEGEFIGTWSEWKDLVKELEENWGFAYSDLKKRPATEEEIELMKKLRE